MQARQNFTVVGVFENEADADRAIRQLYDAGFRDDQIGVARKHVDVVAGETVDDETETGSGAVTGAVAGLGLGALTGLGVLSGIIPVIGPAIAGGTLGVILSNAAAGAGIAGLIGSLVGAGVPEHEARYYEDEFAAGRTIVTVDTMDKSIEAAEILRRNGAYDMSSRGSTVGDPRRVDVPVRGDDVRATAEKARAVQDVGDDLDEFA